MEIPISFRDLQQVDLDRLAWSGGSAHLDALDQALRRSWLGEVELVVGELPTGTLVAAGALDHTRQPPQLWMLSVRESWQGLGVGTALIADLERRAADAGHRQVGLTVEFDNPRARALYERLGYRADGDALEEWPIDSGERYVTVCTAMAKKLG